MFTASCHCGAVHLELDRPPKEITECNCSICRRYGVLWAYYVPGEVRINRNAPTDIYMWDDRSIEFHRCGECGCVTHWSPVNTATQRMGINARLLDPEIVRQAALRHLDGAVSEKCVD